jgi:hypothetical protein
MSSNLPRLILGSATSSLAVAVMAAIRGRVERRDTWRPLNAISHIVWGPAAGNESGFSLQYTTVGLLLNGVACGFWAWFQERGRGWIPNPGSIPMLLLSASGVSALAYVTDYHLVPRRFTPGFELSLSRRSFPWLYGALAVGLLIPGLLAARRQARRTA